MSAPPWAGYEAFGPHEGHNARVVPPLPPVVFVAAQVEIRVREQPAHFGEHRVEHGVGALAGGVEGDVEHPPAHGHGPDGVVAGQARVGRQQRPGVAGQVELRHHPNAQLPGVAHHFFYIFLGVVARGPAHGVQARKPPALHPPALVVAQVPVQHVELHGGHAVEVALHGRHRLEVPGGIEQQPAPGKARRIGNVAILRLPAVRRGPQHLPKRGQPPLNAQRRRSREARARRRDAQPVTLISRAGAGYLPAQGQQRRPAKRVVARLPGGLHRHRQQRPLGLGRRGQQQPKQQKRQFRGEFWVGRVTQQAFVIASAAKQSHLFGPFGFRSGAIASSFLLAMTGGLK